MEIQKIVLSGGPCAGKTTALSRIKEELEAEGVRVLTISETASEMMAGGVSPMTCRTSADFQNLRLELQLERESIFERAAAAMDAERVLIVCDRGALDSKTYMTPEVYSAALSRLGKTEAGLRDSYDAVFHLETAAKGAAEHYKKVGVRRESAKDAAILDDRLISAWCGNPHLRIIPARGSFDEKIDRLIEEIKAFVGVPEPYEIEKKYLIEYPDINRFENDPFCRKVKITQTYIIKDGTGCERVRRRGDGDDAVYFHTVKRDVNGAKRIEEERRVTKDEYEDLLNCADPERKTVEKDRYCIVYKNRYLELDVYPFSHDCAVLEAELLHEGDTVELPDYIKIIGEVTGDKKYSNYNLAKDMSL